MAENEMIVAGQGNNRTIVPYSFDGGQIVKQKCKLCKCKFREEVEDWYEKQKRKNYSEIQRKLKNEKSTDLSVNAIKNHMLYHYEAANTNLALSEYSQDVQKWVDMQTNRLAALKTRIGILDREMMTIAAGGEGLELTERRKNAETIKKIADTILTYESKLKDYEAYFEPVTAVFNQLQIIIVDEMQHVENNVTKKVLVSVLQRLKENVGTMVIDSER